MRKVDVACALECNVALYWTNLLGDLMWRELFFG